MAQNRFRGLAVFVCLLPTQPHRVSPSPYRALPEALKTPKTLKKNAEAPSAWLLLHDRTIRLTLSPFERSSSMKPENPFHNPFCNRFHDPVHRRHEATDAEANGPNATIDYARDRFGGLFALLALAVSFVLILRAF
jgi:hypothetical protein